MMTRQQQRASFYFGLSINAALALMNIGVTIIRLLYQDTSRAMYSGALAAFSSAVVWLLITIDHGLRVKLATLESYLEEQKADTRIKQAMANQIESGKVHIGTDMPVTRAH
jgi:hypothetical protein